MARMIPDATPGDPRSEKIVFENLKHAAQTRDWVVFYSIERPNPKNPTGKREIDFLILIPYPYFSVICLEVKGGSYRIRDGQWYHSYSPEPEQPSPPDQSKSAMFVLKNQFKSYFGGGSPLSLGCAVAFTDASEPRGASLPTYLAELIWSDDVRSPDRLYQKLANYAENLSTRRRPNPRNTGAVRSAEIKWHELRRALEPPTMTIETKTIFPTHLDTLRPQLLELTNDQFDSLERIRIQSEWNPHCVIDGAAGTGKTVLAMELARQRCEEEGESVALLCSNPYLSRRFERWAETLSSGKGGRVVAGTPATLPLKVLEGSPLKDNLQRSLDASPQLKESLKSGDLASEWRSFINETVKAMGQGGIFDYLIVDEAQNLSDEVFLKLMDALLKGELANGRWGMFGDFTYQKIAFPGSRDGRKILQDKGLTFSVDKLKINCRNTHEIAAAAAMFVDIESPPISGVHGPLVQIEYFESQDELEKLLDRLVGDLKEREFFSRQIILLSSDSDKLETSPAKGYAGWKLLNMSEAEGTKDLDREDVLSVSGDSSPKTLRYSNIYDFQGLESEVVILVMPLTEKMAKVGGGATLPDYEHLRRVLYTGMSRAKAMLIIVADKSYEEHLEMYPDFEPTYKDFIESTTQLARKS